MTDCNWGYSDGGNEGVPRFPEQSQVELSVPDWGARKVWSWAGLSHFTFHSTDVLSHTLAFTFKLFISQQPKGENHVLWLMVTSTAFHSQLGQLCVEL